MCTCTDVFHLLYHLVDGDIDSESNKMGLHVTFCFKGDEEESEDDDYIPSEDWKKVEF